MKKNNKNFPRISVIIPVYNVEQYLATTIESVIVQNLGFQENIEIILINDGSTDSSEDICLEYKNKFPNNIIYIKQDNAGVSAARNNGKKIARGIFIHFLDSDDVISRNFHSEAIRLLEANINEIDFVAARIQYFDASYSDHYLNYKFKHERIIDLESEPNNPVFHVSSIIFNKQSLDDLEFDEALVIAEDAKFVNTLLYQKKRYGVVSKSSLYYRKRSNSVSAIGGKFNNRSYYLDTPKHFMHYLANLWSNEDGELHEYIQYLLMNDLAWKILEENSQTVLNKKEEDSYKTSIYSLVKKIDDKIILGNSILGINQKIFLLKKKHGKNYARQINFKKGTYYFNDIRLHFLNDMNSAAFNFDFIHDLGGNKFKIEGFPLFDPIHDKDKFFIRTSRGDFPLNSVPRSQRKRGFLGDVYIHFEAFESVIEVTDSDEIKGLVKSTNGEELTLPIHTKQFTGLGPLNSTYTQKKKLILRKIDNFIKVTPRTKKNIIRYEIRFILQLLRNIQLRKALNWTKQNIANIDTMYQFMPKRRLLWEIFGPFGLVLRSAQYGAVDSILRLLYFMGFYKSSRDIWLISDRGAVAGDNGEALFRYILREGKPNADVYFVISKKSSDYERLRKIGNVVDIRSLKYKLLFLRSSKIISSHADYYVYNAFGYRWTHFNDLYHFDFVFLQHGVIQSDLSGWLNRFEKNIKLFVTTSRAEYNSIIEGDYYYDTTRVLLSGLPRFDLLNNKPSGKIMLAPTWRHNLLPEKRHNNDGIRAYSPTFKETEYFKFYSALMTDKDITFALKKANMTGEFYLHPAFSVQIDDFKQNETFKIKRLPYDYKKAFEESEILITDYSSVAFDFAYLRKPVIYTQFDKDIFHQNHISTTGYYSYEKHGFGPIAYDYESAIKEIISLIEDHTKYAEYRQRVDAFFAFNDRHNSKRVYEGIYDRLNHSNTLDIKT